MIPQPVYKYTPGTGGKIEILANGDGPPCSLVASSNGYGVIVGIHEGDVTVEARKIFAALHEAAGLPVPIVLDRVDGDKFGHWFELGRSALGPSVLLDPHASLSFKAAREFAAALVAAIERAENEPDPAEVEALAEAIRGDERAFGGRPDKWAERAARSVLARYTLTERKPGAAS